MGTKLKKSDFKSQYAVAYQGLFIFCDARRLPKHHDTINLGQSLSDELMHIPVQQRNINIDLCLSRIVENYKSVNLTHIELLFTPSLKQDVIGALQKLCRNRKVCVHWPGRIDGNRLVYADPGSPEYYESSYTGYVDTFIIGD